MPELSVASTLCLIRPDARTAPEVLSLLAQRAIAAGYAEVTFEQALLDREDAFPTGLPTPTPVAIPHTDVQHVIRPALAAALLDPPVAFGEMGGSPGRTVDVRVVVALLVTDPKAQVDLLVRVLGVVQRPDWAAGLDGIDDPADLARALNEALGIVVGAE